MMDDHDGDHDGDLDDKDRMDDGHLEYDPTPGEQQAIIDDLTAACNSLGKMDLNDQVYMKDRDCRSCLKEIIRILNTDSRHHTARITLGALNLVKSDLIPLMNQYCDYNDGDQDLFNLIIRLCTNITSSVLLLFENQEVPTEAESTKIYNKLLHGLYGYKEAFARDPKIWHTLNTHLRHTEDDIPFERLLILIRNILHIPVDSSADFGIKSGIDAHELCLYRMEQSAIFHTIIQVASETQRGMDFCFHIIEIVYLMLRDQNPITVAQAKSNPNKRKLDDNDADRKRLAELSARDKRERESKHMGARNIVPRFRNAAFSISNFSSIGNRPVIARSIVESREAVSFDSTKTELRKAKNKKPLSSEANSSVISDRNTKTSKVTYGLKLFSKLFVEKVYANYMQQIKHNLIQKKAADNDESYYLWSIQYFTSFNRHLCLEMDNISETMSSSTLHFIQILITGYQEKLKLEKKRSQMEKISRRLHLAVRAYREILYLVMSIKPGTDFSNVIETIKKNIFTEVEYYSLLLTQFQQYDPCKHCPEYLKDLISTNDAFLELLKGCPNEQDIMSRYCIPEVIRSYLDALRDFKINDTPINLNILKFFERVVHDCKNEVMLMQASLLKCLLEIHDYHPSMPGYDGFVTLTKHVMAIFGEMIHKKRWVMQELLFWKTHNDVIEIETAIDPPPPAPVAANPVRDGDVNLSPSGEQAPSLDDDEQEPPPDDGGQEHPLGDSLEDLMAELGSDSSFDSPPSNGSEGHKEDHNEDQNDINGDNNNNKSQNENRLESDNESNNDVDESDLSDLPSASEDGE